MSSLLYCLIWNLMLVSVFTLFLWMGSWTTWLKYRPALRQLLWMLVLVKLITPPLLALPVLPQLHFLSEDKASKVIDFVTTDTGLAVVAESSEVGTGYPEKIKSNYPAVSGFNLFFLFLFLSLLGSIILWSRAVMIHLRMHHLAREFQSVSPRINRILQELSQSYQLVQVPEAVLLDLPCSPMLWSSLSHPTIILPSAFSAQASDEQLRHVLAHELAHLVRRDSLVSLFAFLVTSLFWWNPVAWFARREMLIAMEASCDALAMKRSVSSRQSYAHTLLSVVSTLSGNQSVLPAAGAQFGEFQSLKRRIEMVACSQVRFTLSRSVCLLTLTCGLLGLVWVPVSAANESDESPAATAPKLAQPDQQVEQKPEPNGPGTATYHQPGINNARLISWGVESSVRAYFFDTEESAESFAKTVSAFKIAQQFQLVLDEDSLIDYDNHKIIMPVNHAKQLQINSNKAILLEGDRKQHQRIERIMKALNAE